jgi:hypothetical protein
VRGKESAGLSPDIPGDSRTAIDWLFVDLRREDRALPIRLRERMRILVVTPPVQRLLVAFKRHCALRRSARTRCK